MKDMKPLLMSFPGAYFVFQSDVNLTKIHADIKNDDKYCLMITTYDQLVVISTRFFASAERSRRLKQSGIACSVSPNECVSSSCNE